MLPILWSAHPAMPIEPTMSDGSPSQATVLDMLNVRISAGTGRTMMFAHGFGCDQNMWRFVAPDFATDFRTILFDHVGAGGSDLGAYDADKYDSLDGYADDVIELARTLDVTNGVFVGHSVSAMIGLVVARRAPELFSTIVLVSPSPCYIDDIDYTGGFTRDEIDELLQFLDSNPMGWSQAMAPVIMGNPDRPELSEELAASLCRTDPEIAKRLARVTFLTDSRGDLGPIDADVLVLQCREDAIAPPGVGAYVQRAIPGSRLVTLDAVGHCPNLSAPASTIAAIRAFV